MRPAGKPGRFGTAVAAAALLGSACPAMAQDDLITNLWLRFGEHCGPVMADKAVDPDRFRDLPPEHRVAKSKDSRRIQVDHQTQDQKWMVSASQSDLAGRRHLSCTVGFHNLQPLDDVPGLGKRLESLLKGSGATDIAGGEDEFIRITSIYATPGSGVDQVVHMDAAGVLPYPEFIAQFQIFSYGLSVSTSGVFDLSEVE